MPHIWSWTLLQGCLVIFYWVYMCVLFFCLCCCFESDVFSGFAMYVDPFGDPSSPKSRVSLVWQVCYIINFILCKLVICFNEHLPTVDIESSTIMHWFKEVSQCVSQVNTHIRFPSMIIPFKVFLLGQFQWGFFIFFFFFLAGGVRGK